MVDAPILHREAGEGDHAKRGGGGAPQARCPEGGAPPLPYLFESEAAAAPSTVLRTVPLPRYAVEDSGGKPYGEPIHATAVAIGDGALLILGRSGAGKSRLAAALIEASTPRRPIRLIGDDRILLVRRAGILWARPHPRIAGFLERRGLGIIAYPFVVDIAVKGVVRLETRGTPGLTTLPDTARENFPTLASVVIDRALAVEAQRDRVLAWWRDAATTPAAKATPEPSGSAKV